MFKSLFTPKKINQLELKNRMIVSAAVTRLANEDGSCSEAFIRYHEDKAKGGWAMMITEDFPVTATAKTYACLPCLHNQAQVESYKELTGRIHKAGSAICCQLYHPGRFASQALTGAEPMAPSAVYNPSQALIPKEMTAEDITELVTAFGDCAARAVEAGFDAVEIHGAHGYLIHQFLSGNTNKRCDKYGGSLYNRNRFLMEVIAEIRSRVGRDFPLLLRLSCADYVPNGITLEESAYTARLAQEATVDAVHCSAGTLENSYVIMPPAAAARALYADNAAHIKKVVDIPVITVGRINEPGLADNIITSGQADFTAMFRASLADPELPNKAKEGKLDEINLCIGCLQGCLGQNKRLEPFTCMVRPLTGHAHEYNIQPATQKKRVAVIGGGVAGCEAAIYAAMRGHDVTVYEKGSRLGGRWIAASIPPGKAEYTSFLSWQKTMMDQYRVKVELNRCLTLDDIRQLKPDHIILACGANDFIPPIKGRDLPHVVKAEDVLLNRVSTGKRVTVIGGGLVGAETADYLARYGMREVSVVEMLPEIMKDGEPGPKHFLMESFREHKVNVYTGAAVAEIGENSVTFNQDGITIDIPADTVVMATGLRASKEWEETLVKEGFLVTSVGDASRGKNGLSNIREGFEAGISV